MAWHAPERFKVIDQVSRADGGVAFVAGVLVHLVLVIQLQRKCGGPRPDHDLRGSCDAQVLCGRVEWRGTGNVGIGHASLGLHTSRFTRIS